MPSAEKRPNKTKLAKYLEILAQEDLSLLILKGGKKTFTSSGHGIKPLLEAIEKIESERLEDSVVVDKMVGKAAALLICYFHAKRVFSQTISQPAVKVLSQQDIEFRAKRTVEKISGRKKGQSCPFEQAVLDIDRPEEGYQVLYSKAKTLSDEL